MNAFSRNAKQGDLLLIADAALQLHYAWDLDFDADPTADLDWEAFDERLDRLESLLANGGSAYTVSRDSRCLVLRVDETVEAAARLAIHVASDAAADHLRQAWAATYGISPDPDKAMHEAIRAVEDVACPLVQNRHAGNNLATLGTVLGELRGNAAHLWELVLPDKEGQPRTVENLVGMMETLWHAQVSRHGGGAKSRRQSQAEAEAAVQLAVLIVHWLKTGVLRRK
ncbi:hypothetical protein [Actinoplanes sp. NPDC023714]|uniref:hypothetical protein n=1 Tax=Actinoplanes sp. NPDC023714 TaxID=3154322 RepID=UPI0033DE415C